MAWSSTSTGLEATELLQSSSIHSLISTVKWTKLRLGGINTLLYSGGLGAYAKTKIITLYIFGPIDHKWRPASLLSSFSIHCMISASSWAGLCESSKAGLVVCNDSKDHRKTKIAPTIPISGIWLRTEQLGLIMESGHLLKRENMQSDNYNHDCDERN